MFKDKVVIVTGCAQGIGLGLVNRFESLGAKVYGIDIVENSYFVGDLGEKEVLESFVKKVLNEQSGVDILVNNAAPLMQGLDECSYEEFEKALKVGVMAPFYLTKLLSSSFNKDASIINLSSTRDSMSQPQTESYSASKGGLATLTHALAMSLAGRVRVNSISPGWIKTSQEPVDENDFNQHPVKRIGTVDDIVELVLFLASEKSSFINAENIVIDGGMSKQMIYDKEYGWKYR